MVDTWLDAMTDLDWFRSKVRELWAEHEQLRELIQRLTSQGIAVAREVKRLRAERDAWEEAGFIARRENERLRAALERDAEDFNRIVHLIAKKQHGNAQQLAIIGRERRQALNKEGE